MLFRLKRTLFIGSMCAMAGLFITSCGQSEEITDTKDVIKTRTILNSDKSRQIGETVEISIEKYAFGPAKITISAGTKVVWTNNDKVVHSVTSDDEKFDSGLFGQNKEFSYVFETPGTYPYHCTPHPHMEASIIVK